MYTNVYTDVSIRMKSSTTHEENTDVNILFTSCFASMGEVGKMAFLSRLLQPLQRPRVI